MWRGAARQAASVLLVVLVLLMMAPGKATERKIDVAYVADPVGNPLSRPHQGPVKVGSPASLIRPDRYEFYTFDETGELIKRLMTLEEIQEIIATGDGDEGHMLTIAQTDFNKPAVAFNFQPPAHVKVHTIVSNVQNVLKAEMEAQKNNPSKPAIFDTPDVSSSWSMILPAIFGNTGGSITPDSLLSAHVGPETDVINVADDNDKLEEYPEEIIDLNDKTEIHKDETIETTALPVTVSSNIENVATEKSTTIADVLSTPSKVAEIIESKTTESDLPVSTKVSPTSAVPSSSIPIEEESKTLPSTSSSVTQTTLIAQPVSEEQVVTTPRTTTTTKTITSTTISSLKDDSSSVTTKKAQDITTSKPSTTTKKTIIKENISSTTVKVTTNKSKPIPTTVKMNPTTQKVTTLETSSPSSIVMSDPLSTSTLKVPTTVKETTTVKQHNKLSSDLKNKTSIEEVTTPKPKESNTIKTSTTQIEKSPTTTKPPTLTTQSSKITTEGIPEETFFDIGQIMNQIANDLGDTTFSHMSNDSFIKEDVTIVNRNEIPESSSAKYVSSTVTTTPANIVNSKPTNAPTAYINVSILKNSVPSLSSTETNDKVESTSEKVTFIKINPVVNKTANLLSSTSTTLSSETDKLVSKPLETAALEADDDYLENNTTPTADDYLPVTKPNLHELSASISDLISQIVSDLKPTLVPMLEKNKTQTDDLFLVKEVNISTVDPLNKLEILSHKLEEKITSSTIAPVKRTTPNTIKENTSTTQTKVSTTTKKYVNEDDIVFSSEKTSVADDVVPTTYRPIVTVFQSPKPFTKNQINKTTNDTKNVTESSTPIISTTIYNYINKLKDEELQSTKTAELQTSTQKINFATKTDSPVKISLNKDTIEKINVPEVTEVNDYYESTTDAGVTEDDEMMEMLNQMSQMFQMQPKSEEMEIIQAPSAINKTTSYKKTDTSIEQESVMASVPKTEASQQKSKNKPETFLEPKNKNSLETSTVVNAVTNANKDHVTNEITTKKSTKVNEATTSKSLNMMNDGTTLKSEKIVEELTTAKKESTINDVTTAKNVIGANEATTRKNYNKITEVTTENKKNKIDEVTTAKIVTNEKVKNYILSFNNTTKTNDGADIKVAENITFVEIPQIPLLKNVDKNLLAAVEDVSVKSVTQSTTPEMDTTTITVSEKIKQTKNNSDDTDSGMKTKSESIDSKKTVTETPISVIEDKFKDDKKDEKKDDSTEYLEVKTENSVKFIDTSAVDNLTTKHNATSVTAEKIENPTKVDIISSTKKAILQMKTNATENAPSKLSTELKKEELNSPFTTVMTTQSPETQTKVMDSTTVNQKNSNISNRFAELQADIKNVSPVDERVTPSTTLNSVNVNRIELKNNKTALKESITNENAWKLVPTVFPHNDTIKSNSSASKVTAINLSQVKPSQGTLILENNLSSIIKKPSHYTSTHIDLNDNKESQGLERTTAGLSDDVFQFSEFCNELGFKYWSAVADNGIDQKRSLVVSNFAVTSMLAMVFLGAKGSTSDEMNEILKLDDMMTFNPHIVFKNVTESIEVSKKSGVATSAFIRELYSDREKGRLLSFYKDRAQQFYSAHVEEVNFKLIGDVIRRRTNLLVKRQTWGKIPEYIKSNNMILKAPLAVFAANIFQTDCSIASTDGRDGEMYFVVSPTIRQRRLVPVPAVLYKSGFLAGYVPELDATVAAIGGANQIVSTILLMPGQQGSTAQGDDIVDLQKRLIESAVKDDTWSKLLRSLVPRQGLELQIPRFSHRSVVNGTSALQLMGLKDLFSDGRADLRGLNGQSNDLFLSDMMSVNTFTMCGEGLIGEQHHVEAYPGEPNKVQRRLWRTPNRPLNIDTPQTQTVGDLWEEPRDYQRAFHDPLHDTSYLLMPLHLRPRQARLPDAIQDPPRLKFDKPFMFFVRHNPTGLILYMGRYNPRLLP